MINTLLVALAIIASLAALIFLLKYIANRQAKARNAAMWQQYHILVAQHNLVPDLVEDFPHRMFALDSERMRFLFIPQEESSARIIVDLSTQQECRLLNSGHSISTTGKNGRTQTEEHLHSISLAFTDVDGKKLSVPVYTEVLDGIEERQRLKDKAAKWQSLLNGLISGMRKRA